MGNVYVYVFRPIERKEETKMAVVVELPIVVIVVGSYSPLVRDSHWPQSTVERDTAQSSR